MRAMRDDDAHVHPMLQQLEALLARLTCRLGCSREHAGLFNRSLLVFYKVNSGPLAAKP